MRRRAVIVLVPLVACALITPAAHADIITVARCQKKIAVAGANFAKRVITATLKCTQAAAECIVQCEQGVFGPPCDPAPPPCCDPDDRNSNQTFDDCMSEADEICAQQTAKIAQYEETKQEKIIAACTPVTQEELCGAQGNGLNFATLNAGCLALDPSYTCNLTNLIGCLGGPLERELVDQISALLDPRAPEVVAALNLQGSFPDIPVARKAREDLPPGKVDVWAISGQAGDEIKVRVNTRDDNGNDTSNLEPELILLGNDGVTPVADTGVAPGPCKAAPVCGADCPQIKRHLPFSGTFHVAVRANTSNGCTGGRYKLIVVSPGGTVPALAADDVDP